MGTRGAFDPRGLGMLRGEEFGQLRAEQRERRHTQLGGEMAGTGVVADEPVGGIEDGKQAIEVLQGIVEQGYLPTCGGEARGDFLEAIQRPFPHSMTGAGVNHDVAAPAVACCGGRGRPTERLREGLPVFRPMRRGRRRQGAAQQDS